jgi:hypothetical protein
MRIHLDRVPKDLLEQFPPEGNERHPKGYRKFDTHEITKYKRLADRFTNLLRELFLETYDEGFLDVHVGFYQAFWDYDIDEGLHDLYESEFVVNVDYSDIPRRSRYMPFEVQYNEICDIVREMTAKK